MQRQAAVPAGFESATPARLIAGQPAVYIVAPDGVAETGGMGRLMAYMAGHWLAAGEGPSFRFIDPYGPASLPLMPFYCLRALWQILWQGLRGRIALLHVHLASKGSLVRKSLILLLARALGLPVLLHLHQPRLLDQLEALPAPLRRLFVWILAGAERVVVLGAVLRPRVAAFLGLDPARVVVLHNAVAGPEGLPERDPAKPPRLLFLGRLEPGKGLDNLLRALARPELAELAWQATVAGPGPLERYRRMTAELGLSERVALLGWQEEAAVGRLLAESDLFVLPSRVEGLSIALLEAMSFGLAVVVSNSGAVTEAVVEGESGLLVPPDEPEALARALVRLIGEPALGARLQAGARQSYEERFAIPAYCRRLEALYRETLASGRRAGRWGKAGEAREGAEKARGAGS